jgi:hypothetical protein
MSLATCHAHCIEKRTGEGAMHRPISTKTHGMIDYLWATTAGAVPAALQSASRTATLMRRAGVASGMNALVTNYEAGAVRILPMKGHLALDILMCAVLIASPFFLPRAERRYATVPILLGAIGLLTAMLTETASPKEMEAFVPSRELSEAVADPEAARG